jgi:hypothetical protein
VLYVARDIVQEDAKLYLKIRNIHVSTANATWKRSIIVQEKKRSIKHFDVGNQNVLNISPQIEKRKSNYRNRSLIFHFLGIKPSRPRLSHNHHMLNRVVVNVPINHVAACLSSSMLQLPSDCLFLLKRGSMEKGKAAANKGLHLGKFISPGPKDHFPNSGIFRCSLERYGIAQLGYCMGRTHANSEWPLLISRAQAAKTFAHNGSMDASNSNHKFAVLKNQGIRKCKIITGGQNKEN